MELREYENNERYDRMDRVKGGVSDKKVRLAEAYGWSCRPLGGDLVWYQTPRYLLELNVLIFI